MGFLLPNAPAYSDWDSLLQRSLRHGDRVELSAPVETPCKPPPFLSVPSSESPPLLGSSAASSAAAGQLSGLHSIAHQFLQTPACISTSTDGRARQAGSGGSLGGSFATCSTTYSGESHMSPSPVHEGTVSASENDLEAESLALAWRLQQEEQRALAEAIEALSPAPGSAHHRARGSGSAGSAARATGGGAEGEDVSFTTDAGGDDIMELDEEEEDDEDASLRLAIRLQQEELHWHEIASRRTVSEAMHIEPAQGGAFGQQGAMGGGARGQGAVLGQGGPMGQGGPVGGGTFGVGDATQIQSDEDEP
jgi:hypothetical protein